MSNSMIYLWMKDFQVNKMLVILSIVVSLRLMLVSAKREQCSTLPGPINRDNCIIFDSDEVCFKKRSSGTGPFLDHYNISCGIDGEFLILPFCIDIDECSELSHLCELSTTECVNTPGSYFCGCKEGMQPFPNCRYDIFLNCLLLLIKS